MEAFWLREDMQWAYDAWEYVQWLDAAEYAQWEENINYVAALKAAREARRTSYVARGSGSGYCDPDVLAQYGFSDLAKAVDVCNCESGGRDGQYSPSGLHYGIWQLDAGHRNAGGGWSPESQTAYVAEYTKNGDWSPWECA